MRKIAVKVSRRINKVQTNKVIDLNAYRHQKKATEDLFSQIITTEAAIKSGLDPLYSVYIHTQNLLSVLVEVLQEIPEPSLSPFFNSIAAATDTYVPSCPPMSPLTNSYFNCWSMFDLCAGLHQETLATIIVDLAKQFGLHQNMVTVMQAMQDSRMGIYEFMGRKDGKILLRELIGNEIVPCICPAGYLGTQPGELWFVRILPPVLGPFDYSVIFITPYVLLSPGKDGWEAYLNRTVGSKKTRTTATSLQNLMKHGLSGHYWHEYIFQAYANHQHDVVFLQGLPDISSSRPHHTVTANYASLLPDAPSA
jgi:hypothetical protein